MEADLRTDDVKLNDEEYLMSFLDNSHQTMAFWFRSLNWTASSMRKCLIASWYPIATLMYRRAQVSSMRLTWPVTFRR